MRDKCSYKVKANTVVTTSAGKDRCQDMNTHSIKVLDKVYNKNSDSNEDGRGVLTATATVRHRRSKKVVPTAEDMQPHRMNRILNRCQQAELYWAPSHEEENYTVVDNMSMDDGNYQVTKLKGHGANRLGFRDDVHVRKNAMWPGPQSHGHGDHLSDTHKTEYHHESVYQEPHYAASLSPSPSLHGSETNYNKETYDHHRAIAPNDSWESREGTPWASAQALSKPASTEDAYYNGNHEQSRRLPHEDPHIHRNSRPTHEDLHHHHVPTQGPLPCIALCCCCRLAQLQKSGESSCCLGLRLTGEHTHDHFYQHGPHTKHHDTSRVYEPGSDQGKTVKRASYEEPHRISPGNQSDQSYPVGYPHDHAHPDTIRKEGIFTNYEDRHSPRGDFGRARSMSNVDPGHPTSYSPHHDHAPHHDKHIHGHHPETSHHVGYDYIDRPHGSQKGEGHLPHGEHYDGEHRGKILPPHHDEGHHTRHDYPEHHDHGQPDHPKHHDSPHHGEGHSPHGEHYDREHRRKNHVPHHDEGHHTHHDYPDHRYDHGPHHGGDHSPHGEHYDGEHRGKTHVPHHDEGHHTHHDYPDHRYDHGPHHGGVHSPHGEHYDREYHRKTHAPHHDYPDHPHDYGHLDHQKPPEPPHHGDDHGEHYNRDHHHKSHVPHHDHPDHPSYDLDYSRSRNPPYSDNWRSHEELLSKGYTFDQGTDCPPQSKISPDGSCQTGVCCLPFLVTSCTLHGDVSGEQPKKCMGEICNNTTNSCADQPQCTGAAWNPKNTQDECNHCFELCDVRNEWQVPLSSRLSDEVTPEDPEHTRIVIKPFQEPQNCASPGELTQSPIKHGFRVKAYTNGITSSPKHGHKPLTQAPKATQLSYRCSGGQVRLASPKADRTQVVSTCCPRDSATNDCKDPREVNWKDMTIKVSMRQKPSESQPKNSTFIKVNSKRYPS